MATNKPLTIKELAKVCQDEIKRGNGDNVIMLSDDDEGNGYHYCWYSFTTPAELLDGLEDYDMDIDGLDEEIASKDKTSLLG